MFYRISSKGGVDFGVYPGNTPEEAFAAMVADAGESEATGSPADWFIEEVPETEA